MAKVYVIHYSQYSFHFNYMNTWTKCDMIRIHHRRSQLWTCHQKIIVDIVLAAEHFSAQNILSVDFKKEHFCYNTVKKVLPIKKGHPFQNRWNKQHQKVIEIDTSSHNLAKGSQSVLIFKTCIQKLGFVPALFLKWRLKQFLW